MSVNQGNLALLDDPVARDLLQSRIPARLAYVWHDGTPRVVPIWFHWNGQEFVLSGPPDAPKVEAIRAKPQVALTIDDHTAWPYKALLIRGTARIETGEGVAPAYAASARRYFGEEQGRVWLEMVDGLFDQMASVVVQPEWAGVIDFQTRFPSKIASRMG